MCSELLRKTAQRTVNTRVVAPILARYCLSAVTAVPTGRARSGGAGTYAEATQISGSSLSDNPAQTSKEALAKIAENAPQILPGEPSGRKKNSPRKALCERL
jgi:hypothetical protein